MINYLKIIIISITFFHFFNTFSQPIINTQQSDTLGFANRQNNTGITLTLGAGSSVYETSFILSPDISWT